MIETLLLAGLGFLVANLLWLLVLPAISRRADRLAARRAELTFPLSMEEIAAERDHLRAEFALRQRELERKAQDSQTLRAGAMAQIGERDRMVAELKILVDDRDLSIAGLKSELATTQGQLADTRTRLFDEEKVHAATRADLATTSQTLSERDQDVAGLRIERADLTASLNQRVQELAESRARAAALDQDLAHSNGDLARLKVDHEALGAEKDRLRILLAESETMSMARATEASDLTDKLNRTQRQLADEQASLQDTRTTLEARIAAYAALEAERQSLATRLNAANDRIATLQAEAKSLRTDRQALEGKLIAASQEIERSNLLIRNAHADQARLDNAHASQRREREARIEALRNDLAAAQAQAKQARAERAQLKTEITTLRRAAEQAAARITAENRDLRAEIVRIGDMFLAGKGRGEPVTPPRVVANSPDRPLRTPTRRAAE